MDLDNALWDPEDWKTLLYVILKQGMNDYIQLQHPTKRNKKYLQEAFNSAVDMFFDDEFRFQPELSNDNGDPMSFEDFAHELMGKKVSLENLREKLIADSKQFWENKNILTIDIPESFVYDGHVYNVLHTEGDSKIDFVEKSIKCNRDGSNSDNELEFMNLVVEIMLYHEEIRMNSKQRSDLARALFRMLKVNSCFRGA